MEKRFITWALLIALYACPIHINAQLRIVGTGNVGIAVADTIEPLSALSIGGAGVEGAQLSVCGNGLPSENQFGVVSHIDMELYDVHMYSVWGRSAGVARTLMGVRGEALASSGIVTVPSHPHPLVCTNICYGVYGIAGGSIRDNYGVYGTLQYNGGQGAGVFGTTGGGEYNIGGCYAGYFRGQTKVNGDFYALSLNTFTNPSMMRDVRYSDDGLSQSVLSLHTIQYQLQDTVTESQRVHYGFDAQEMQSFFPDLVQKDNAGNVSINYVELIPLLVQTIKDLSAEVESLKNVKSNKE